jgi:hypothetical protein
MFPQNFVKEYDNGLYKLRSQLKISFYNIPKHIIIFEVAKGRCNPSNAFYQIEDDFPT